MQGGCMCGQYRYEISGETRDRTLCHCTSCRRSTGAPAVAWLSVSHEDFRVLCGALTRHRSSLDVTRSFCPRCGTQILYEHAARAHELDVTIASLDQPNECPPRDHTWNEDRVRWLAIADSLPVYAKTRA